MAEEVKVVVKQEQQGTALKDAVKQGEELAATQKRINDLYKAAAAYENKGMTTAAQSARSEARGLEADLKRATRERLADERMVTREHREQEAVSKAREGRLQRLGNAAAGLANNIAGASPLTGVTSALSSIGGPAVLIASVAAAVAGAVASRGMNMSRDSRLVGLQANANEELQDFDSERMRGFEGSASGARQAGLQAKRELVALEGQRAVLEEEAKPRPFSRLWFTNKIFGSDLKTEEGERALQENAAASALAMKKQSDAKEAQKEQFKRQGALEMELDRRMASGNNADKRGIIAIKDKLVWWKTYNHYLDQLGDTAMGRAQSSKAAETAVELEEKRRAGNFARFITARSSAGDTARAISASYSAENRNGDGTAKAVQGLHATVAAQAKHAEARDAEWRFRGFSRNLTKR